MKDKNREVEKKKLFRYVEMPNGTKIKLNKIGYGVKFKGAVPIVITNLKDL